jgi:hypothetical protein
MNKQTFACGNKALTYARTLLARGYQVSGKGMAGSFVIVTNAPANERESALFVAYVR